MGDYYLAINNQLRVTPNHRFYSDNKWVYADDLKIGDSLFYPSSSYKVYSIYKVFERTYTYNFEVEGCHNYFVSMETKKTDTKNYADRGILVHNSNPDIVKPTDLEDVYVGAIVDFECNFIGGAPPYTYTWEFGDGATKSGNGATTVAEINTKHTYSQIRACQVNLSVTGIGSTQITINVINYLNGVPPKATFTWFDSDGPYQGEQWIFLDASGCSSYGDKTYRWEEIKESGLNQYLGNTQILNHQFTDDNQHTVKLNLTDTYSWGRYYDEFTTTVQANTPIPHEPEKPWVLTGKDVYPKTVDTFLPYPEDYYVKYTDLNKDSENSHYELFEVKAKKTSGMPILDYNKTVNLSSYVTTLEYSVIYNDIKSALGLESTERLYNYRIEIISEDGTELLNFGALDTNAIATESTSRDVLIYKPPLAESTLAKPYDWKILSEPQYIKGKITVYLFIGGISP
jgi:hypothetical protein